MSYNDLDVFKDEIMNLKKSDLVKLNKNLVEKIKIMNENYEQYFDKYKNLVLNLKKQLK